MKEYIKIHNHITVPFVTVEIAGQLLVFTVPTILMMYDGREVLRESRFIDFQKVERMLNSFTANPRLRNQCGKEELAKLSDYFNRRKEDA